MQASQAPAGQHPLVGVAKLLNVSCSTQRAFKESRAFNNKVGTPRVRMDLRSARLHNHDVQATLNMHRPGRNLLMSTRRGTVDPAHRTHRSTHTSDPAQVTTLQAQATPPPARKLSPVICHKFKPHVQ